MVYCNFLLNLLLDNYISRTDEGDALKSIVRSSIVEGEFFDRRTKYSRFNKNILSCSPGH